MAREKGICFGLENREGLEELPLDADFAGFLQESLPDSSIYGYWHDTGHAQLKHSRVYSIIASISKPWLSAWLGFTCMM